MESGQHLSFRLRESPAAPRAPLVFIEPGDPKTTIDYLVTSMEATGRLHETRAHVDLPGADRVTVIDVRWGGRWEGMEIVASPGAPGR